MLQREARLCRTTPGGSPCRGTSGGRREGSKCEPRSPLFRFPAFGDFAFHWRVCGAGGGVPLPFVKIGGRLVAEKSQQAEEEVKQATDMFQFAALINKEFSRERKVLVLEHLWTVAFADA